MFGCKVNKSILTDNVYAAEYLQNEKLFSKVTLTKKAPLSMAGAASSARQQGYDGFFMVDFRGPTLRDGIVLKIDYGSATVRLVTKDGTLVYEQTATLTGKANSPENPTERQVAEALSLSLLSDLEQSMGAKTAVSTDGHKEENMVDKAVNKVKGWLN
ncbi:MAG: hypothetical protein KBC35_00735 [Candidatus Pacebacteria bacterium]|nr:hypothetical protein [Candidatus Paceibacterota bacterium]